MTVIKTELFRSEFAFKAVRGKQIQIRQDVQEGILVFESRVIETFCCRESFDGHVGEKHAIRRQVALWCQFRVPVHFQLRFRFSHQQPYGSTITAPARKQHSTFPNPCSGLQKIYPVKTATADKRMTRSALFCLFCACLEQVFGKKMFSLAGLKNDFCNNGRALLRCRTTTMFYKNATVRFRFCNRLAGFTCPENSWFASGVPGYHTA